MYICVCVSNVGTVAAILPSHVLSVGLPHLVLQGEALCEAGDEPPTWALGRYAVCYATLEDTILNYTALCYPTSTSLQDSRCLNSDVPSLFALANGFVFQPFAFGAGLRARIYTP